MLISEVSKNIFISQKTEVWNPTPSIPGNTMCRIYYVIWNNSKLTWALLEQWCYILEVSDPMALPENFPELR